MDTRNAFLVRLRRLSIRERASGRPLVTDVSVRLREGRCLGIVGESGSGKTLICRALMGLLPPELVVDGQALFAGVDMPHAPAPLARRLRGTGVSAVFQQPGSAFDPLFTLGAQWRATWRERRGLTARQADDLAEAVRRQVNLPAAALDSYPHQLSGGMLQRGMIGLSLGLECRLLIADEPTSSLDAPNRQEILHLLARLKEERRLSLIVVSHDLAVARRLADSLLVMRHGVCVEQGDTDAVLSSPRHACTQRLVRTRRLLTSALDHLTPGLQTPEGTPPPRRAHRTAEETPTPRRDSSAGPALVAAAPAPGIPFLQVRGLSKSYPVRAGGLFGGRVRRPVLHDIGFRLEKGVTLGLLGESGSGKSTLARLLLGLEAPDAGEILLEGQPVAAWRRRHRGGMSVVFQDYAQSVNPGLTVRQIIAEGREAAPGRPAGPEAVAALMERVELPSRLLDRLPHQLSGGQLQRVCIARALAADPALLIFDEAVSALDVSIQAEVLRLLATLRGRTTQIFITHDIQAAALLCDRVMVLHQGRLTDDCPLTELSTASPRLRHLLDASLRLDLSTDRAHTSHTAQEERS